MLMLEEFDIIKFMNRPRLLKLSFEHNYMMTLGSCIESDQIRYIEPDELGFKVRYCYSYFAKEYEVFLITTDDELYNYILPYFVEQKLNK